MPKISVPRLAAWTLVFILTSALPLAAQTGETASPCPWPEARQFDFWIGEWDVVNKGLTPGGWVETGRATNRVYAVVDGCAIVEHWRGTAWNRKTIGFSVRAYDPESAEWLLVLNWPAPNRPGFGVLDGKFKDGRGEFFTEPRGPEGQEVTQRYSFSEVEESSFQWDAARSRDGENWQMYWVMEFTRRDPVRDIPLWNGPWNHANRERRCRQPEAAQLDFTLGGWQGVERRVDAEGNWQERPARVNVLPILEGCAIVDFVEVGAEGEESYERFGVYSWQPAAGNWAQWELDSPDPVLRNATGTFEDGAIVFVTPGEEDELRRVTWRRGEGESLVREDERSSDGGETWQKVTVLELEPIFLWGRSALAEKPPGGGS